jgi:hypothetical protein
MPNEFLLLIPKSQEIVNKQYAIGDIFSCHKSFGLQTKYKAWHVLLSSSDLGRRENAYKVSFRHNYTSGLWMLIINGEIKAKYKEQLSNNPFVVSFQLNGHSFELNVSRSSTLNHSYSLTIDGHQVKEVREKADISVDEPAPRFVEITEVKNCKIDGKIVSVYQICCHLESGEKLFIERRYSDFQNLNTIIMGQTGRHLRSTLPSLPGKILNPFLDQTTDSFIQARRDGLQRYLKQLLTNSKVIRRKNLSFQ